MYKHLLFLDNLGGGELFIIVLFVLIFFGSDKIPGIMKSLGKAMREFKTAMDQVQQDIETNIQQPVKSVTRDLQKQLEETTKETQKEIDKIVEEKKEEIKSSEK